MVAGLIARHWSTCPRAQAIPSAKAPACCALAVTTAVRWALKADGAPPSGLGGCVAMRTFQRRSRWNANSQAARHPRASPACVTRPSSCSSG